MDLAKKEMLLKKGWREEDIRKAEAVLEKTELKDLLFSKITFWSALVVIVFANLMVSLVLIPFMIILNSNALYFTVIVLAGVVGFLYNFLILDIGHLEKKHHLLAGIIIPLVGLVNTTIMVLVSNRFIQDLKVQNSPHNPWLVGIVFAVAFILPYLVDRIRGKHLFYSKRHK